MLFFKYPYCSGVKHLVLWKVSVTPQRPFKLYLVRLVCVSALHTRNMCFALVVSAGFPPSLVKIHQVLIRQTSQISRVLNLNCSADLSKRRVIKVSKPLALTIEISKPLALTIEISKPLTLANESRNLLSWQIINQLIQPTSLNSAQWGIKNHMIQSWSLRPPTPNHD